MAKTKTLKIDGEKLKREIKKRGLNGREVGPLVGHSETWVAGCVHQGRISEAGAVLLEKILNLPREAYELSNDAPQELAEPRPATIDDTTLRQLQTVIYRGVVDALTSLDVAAVAEQVYGDLLYRAVKAATTEALKGE